MRRVLDGPEDRHNRGGRATPSRRDPLKSPIPPDVCELLNEVTKPLREAARPRAKRGAILKFPGQTHDFAAR